MAEEAQEEEVEDYPTLEEAADISNDQLRRPYRRLAVKLPPDKNPDDPKAQEKFAEVNDAYQSINDNMFLRHVKLILFSTF